MINWYYVYFKTEFVWFEIIIEKMYNHLQYMLPAFLIMASCHAVSKNAEKTANLLHRVQNRRDKRIKEIVSMTLHLKKNCNYVRIHMLL